MRTDDGNCDTRYTLTVLVVLDVKCLNVDTRAVQPDCSPTVNYAYLNVRHLIVFTV
jgi:hypothetical protein